LTITGQTPFQRWEASPGQAYLKRAHVRTFSLNILQMNGLEFIEAVRRLRDPQDGLALFSDSNREAGNQAHRELSRHFHNFLSASKTLVDHTRALMRVHYEGSDLLAAYEDKAGGEVGAKPVVKFVHDLRNYVVHRGLPNIIRSLHMSQDPAQPEAGATFELSVFLKTGELLTWSKWGVGARAFIADAGEILEVQGFVERYLAEIAALHAWLDRELAAIHSTEVEESRDLKAIAFGSADFTGNASQAPEKEQVQAKFSFSQAQTKDLQGLAEELFRAIRELVFRERPKGFQSHRPVAGQITSADLIEAAKYRGLDEGDVPVVSFIEKDGRVYGLDSAVFDRIGRLAELAHEADWAREGFGYPFVEKTFIAWARQQVVGEAAPFVERMIEAAKVQIVPRTVWIPIAHFEIEQSFDFGPVSLKPLTGAEIEALRQRVEPNPRPEHLADLEALFAMIKSDIQGLAAVVFETDAEPGHAEARGLLVAREAVELLRFFAPGANVVDAICPIALLGSERVPGATALIEGEGSFVATSSIDADRVRTWRMPVSNLESLRHSGLDTVGHLVANNELSPFEADVRASLLIFSRSLLFGDVRYRLSQALLAIEGILLRHQMEPRVVTVADRAGLILANGPAGLSELADMVRRSYRLLETSAARAFWPHEVETARTVVFVAHHILINGIQNLDRFVSRDGFLDEIEQLRSPSDQR
jgi:hypothetical protein